LQTGPLGWGTGVGQWGEPGNPRAERVERIYPTSGVSGLECRLGLDEAGLDAARDDDRRGRARVRREAVDLSDTIKPDPDEDRWDPRIVGADEVEPVDPFSVGDRLTGKLGNVRVDELMVVLRSQEESLAHIR